MGVFYIPWVLTLLAYGFVVLHADDGVFFIDCGSAVPVDSVVVSGCQAHPCTFNGGELYNITITQEYIDSTSTTDLQSRMIFIGANFEVTAKIEQPCGSVPCPVDDKVLSPEIAVSVQIDTPMYEGLAVLSLNATYWYGGVHRMQFCVRFDINYIPYKTSIYQGYNKCATSTSKRRRRSV